MTQTIRYMAEPTDAQPVRPWFGRQSRDCRKAQDASRRAARAARELKYAQSAEDAAGVSAILGMATTD